MTTDQVPEVPIGGLDELADRMVASADLWCDESRPDTTLGRMEGFLHSLLVVFAGNAGWLPPYELAAKDRPDYDLGAQHLNEVLFHLHRVTDDGEVKLLTDLRELAEAHVRYPAESMEATMRAFIRGVCGLIRTWYTLRRLECDEETGCVVGRGYDIAPLLGYTVEAKFDERIRRRG